MSSYANWNSNSDRTYKKYNCSGFASAPDEIRSYECYDGKDFETRVKDYYHGPGVFKDGLFYPKKTAIIGKKINKDKVKGVSFKKRPYSELCLGDSAPMLALSKANNYHFNSDYRNAIKWYVETIKVNPKECVNTGSVEAKNQLALIKSRIGTYEFNRYKGLPFEPKLCQDGTISESYVDDECPSRALIVEGHPIKNDYNNKIYKTGTNMIVVIMYDKGVKYYEDGKNRLKGFKLILEAANYDFYKAQHKLGDMYSMNGSHGGLAIDYSDKEAFKWYKKSANQGYAESQYEVGAMYHYGEGISKKYSEAIRWYTKAALQNQVDAQYELGQMYANGQGVPVNYKKAIRWYSLAAEQNDTRASNKVKELLLVKLALNSGFTQQEISESEGVQNKKTALNFGFTQQEISKGEGIQNFNRARKVANIDTSPPEIRTYNSDSFTTTEKYITLSGDIKDDSKIAKVTINGKEVAIKNDGFNQFVVPEYIQLGRNEFNIVSIDVFGNKSSKKIVFNREKAVSKNKDKRLAPPTTVRRSSPNAVALIIGVDKYESIVSAPWAESDASVFYDYVQNTLGISEDRIKLLTGSESSEAGIWKSIERWLPTEVDKNKSDVYVYFAGHGLASTDGNNAYLIPWDGDTDLLERTAILRSELIDGLKDLDAKSVTLFMDTCYSGKARGGKGTLVANSRGLRIVKKDKLNNLPSNFTLFSAAGNDETASSHPSLKHGLFSYWMMRGLGGDADSNNDRKITNGELHVFIDKNVQKNAVSMGRKQHPQLVGDKDKVIASW